MKIKELPIDERPRERLLKYGSDQLTNEELLSIILKTGTRKNSVKEVSQKLLKEINNINNLSDCSIDRLTQVDGIGKIKAIEILASLEIGKRIYLKKNNCYLNKLTSAKEIFEYMNYYLYDKKQEHFYCLYFNTKQELLNKKLLFIGTINRSIVHPREIFKEAYLLSAVSIICVHNHPTGDLKPSFEDKRLTKSLVELGLLNAIPITDHIIVSNSNYYSFYESGELI